jgi:hypothetical protein
MTCIVGIAENGRVYLGGDSAGVAGWDLTVRGDPKVFQNGECVFGFTSSFRMGQLLRFSFMPPAQPLGSDNYAHMCTTFVNEVRECLKRGGFASKKDEAEAGGNFLVGYRGQRMDSRLWAAALRSRAARCSAQWDRIRWSGSEWH